MKMIKKINSYEILFVIPALGYMLIFVGYPIIYNIVLSFQDTTLMNIGSASKEFVGLENYKNIFSSPLIFITLKNTLFYTVMCLIIQFSLGFLMALFFNLKFRISGFLRGIIIISWMMPTIATALVFKFMLSETGIVNNYLMILGLIKEPILWISNQDTAMWGLIIANSWVGIPFNMLLLSTGLSNVPDSIIESAKIDGAVAWQRLIFIVVPMIKPAILSVLVLGFVYTFKVFDLVFTMTAGGPVNSTEVLSTYSYLLSFKYYYFSQGASVANILAIFLIIVSFIYVRLTSKEEVGE
ncbi:carbohydrate ABC transporter permease [Brachyspira sp. SAP_772]|uniref:carbohydrate ABC transporter permease n=1 Tax=Brachyspira sp. SAP_772 TaxID=2608385 RepID=UPI0018DF9160|nr:sugar ABC transporter permease [Brachyspira sp. SAP_772]